MFLDWDHIPLHPERKPAPTPVVDRARVDGRHRAEQMRAEAVKRAEEAKAAELARVQKLRDMEQAERDRALALLVAKFRCVVDQAAGTPPPMMRTITEIVSAVSGISVEEIHGESRFSQTAKARLIVMWLSRRFAKKSYPEIGRLLGKRDHSTAIHGVRRVEKLVADGVVAWPEHDTALEWAKVLWETPWPNNLTGNTNARRGQEARRAKMAAQS